MWADKDKKVVVIGLGYIGLPTAALIADAGARVVGVDLREEVVRAVNAGHAPIEEADLEALVRAGVANGRLSASLKPETANVFIIAVPTPLGPSQCADLSHVWAAARAVAPCLQPGTLIILESTCPVGTTESLRDYWATARPDLRFPQSGKAGDADVALAYCPERVLPGRILAELVANDRCIGGITLACAQRAREFYRPFVQGACLTTTARVAEMVKLAENSFRDVNIAFANELSLAADHLGVDVWEVIRLANRHPRVEILRPGPGVGGHCIAVDPWFLVHGAPQATPLVRAARHVNDHKAQHVARRAAALMDAHPSARAAILGLSFKPDVADLRESPALAIALELARQFGPRLLVVEPHIAALPPTLEEAGTRLVPLDTAMAACDVLILLVGHQAFRQVPVADRAGKAIYDSCGLWHGLGAGGAASDLSTVPQFGLEPAGR